MKVMLDCDKAGERVSNIDEEREGYAAIVHIL